MRLSRSLWSEYFEEMAMINAQMGFQEAFVDQLLTGNSDIVTLIILAFIALIVFRVLGMAADAVVTMVSGFVKVMTGTLIPVAFILFLLLIALGMI
jgi:hypothetical protein